jgi:hypothetical protein
MAEKSQPTPQSVKLQDATTPPAAPQAPQVKYPRLLPRKYASVPSQEYINERVNDAIAWYDKSADKQKKLYLRMRATTVIGGALVPVLVNVNLDYVDILTTIISLIVVLLVSLESVYHFREQWTNYRSTEQGLRHEYFLFTSKGGIYATKNKAAAYQYFVERVEDLISSENASTLKVLSSVADTGASGGTKAKSSGKKR